MKLDDVIREFVESYESRDPDYTPTDHERALIEDAINGFIGDFLKKRYSRRPLPEDDDVVAALHVLGGHASASALCDALVAAGYSRRYSQLAIQRAQERGHFDVCPDWTLRVRYEYVRIVETEPRSHQPE